MDEIKDLDGNRLTYLPWVGKKWPQSKEKDKSFGFIFSTNDEILLSSQGDNIWELPGGTVEKDENAIETLMREVYEETAIKICKNSARPFSCTNVFKDKSKVLYKREFAYLARVCDIDDFINDPGGEHKYRRFVSMDEFPEVFHWGDSILPIISRLKKELKLLN